MNDVHSVLHALVRLEREYCGLEAVRKGAVHEHLCLRTSYKEEMKTTEE